METHLQALRSLGWTFDQYEVGAKDEQVLQLRQEREMKQNKQYLAEKEKLKALQRYLALQAAQEAEANKHDSSLAAASTASKAKHDSHWLVRRPVLNWLYRQWYGSETNHNSTDTTNSVPMTNTNNAILLELIQEQEEVDGEREHTPSLDIINCSTTASMGDL